MQNQGSEGEGIFGRAPTFAAASASEDPEVDSVDTIQREQLTQNDVIIAVMGPTGAGKTTFIQTVTGREFGVSHGLSSCTSQVSAVRVRISGGVNIVLIDTPGFDDTHLSDLEVLRIIAEWLKEVRQDKLELSGVIYLHRIPDNRMAGTPLKNLVMFKKLCGEDFFKRVILITTMWPRVDDRDYEACLEREKELKEDYWKEMIDRGSTTLRFENTKTSGWSILDPIISAEANRRWDTLIQALKIQQELVDERKKLPDTEAGRQLRDLIEGFVEKKNDILRRLRDEVGKATDPGITEVLLGELVQLRKEQEKAMKDMHRLDPSLVERVRRIISIIYHRFRPRRPQDLGSDARVQIRALISHIVMNSSLKASMIELRDEEAQCVVDVINVVLHEANILTVDERKRVLSLLCKLAKSAHVLPRCYELKGVQYDPKSFVPGGFADVYRGEYEKQQICIKMVRLSCNDPPQRLTAHVRELVLWAHLSHPNILPFYGVYGDEQSQRPCLISPWMENGNLCDYLKKNPGSLRMLLVSDMINGLRYLHEFGIVHRDLKATNVLVSDEGRALIADFGISYIATSANQTSFKGTFRWCAPELFGGNSGDNGTFPTSESDMWSFGCVCYEVFTGREPFHQYQNEHAVIPALLIRQEIPTRPTSGDGYGQIDDLMWDVMTRCWNRVPQERPTCEELQGFFRGLRLTDDRPRTQSRAKDIAFWRALNLANLKSSKEVDYERVRQILIDIQRSVDQAENVN